MRRDTLIDFFDEIVSFNGTFIVHDDSFRTRTFSYKDVGRASKAFASRLAASGVGKGDKVVIFSENRPEWLVAFWGCLLIGVIVVPIDYRSAPDFLTRDITRSLPLFDRLNREPTVAVELLRTFDQRGENVKFSATTHPLE